MKEMTLTVKLNHPDDMIISDVMDALGEMIVLGRSKLAAATQDVVAQQCLRVKIKTIMFEMKKDL